MSENILVVEYEPRYTERVRQALAGQPFNAMFAKDGDEAIRALQSQAGQPKLIVLSSVVPKISTTELISTIRGRFPLEQTPILLTVSGYNGKSPKDDARRVGASDILPKPYSETEFLGKIQQMLGVAPAAQKPKLSPTETEGEGAGELKMAKRHAGSRETEDVDKMLADTLAGVMPQRKKEPAPAPHVPKPRPSSGNADLDRLMHDTLSGLERGRKPSDAPAARGEPGTAGAPAAAPVSQPKAAVADTLRETGKEQPKAAAAAEGLAERSDPLFADDLRQDEEDPADGTRFGQYVLIDKIATGGMAEVWKARMRGVEGFQKIVAIKKILPHLSDNQDFVEMFIDEAKLAAQLNHNNIIHIYDLGKIQSSYYIAMEYIDGFDLKTILRRAEERGQPMSVELALFIASKIASALDYAHRKKDFDSRELGLVHRDVSPQNVLISQEGDIKLCDFGIAKAASKASHTQAGALKGKLQYMAPEQAWGRTIDRRSDVFSLGTVLFEMLTAKKLFAGESELSILDQVREAQIVAPSTHNDEITPEIDAIVMKALQKDPADRYQTAGDMSREIDAILYSFRPTPTSADLAIYMHHLSATEPVAAEPVFEQSPEMLPPPPPVRAAGVSPSVPVSAIPAASGMTAPSVGAQVITSPESARELSLEEAPKKKRGLFIAAAALLLALAAGAAFMMMRDPATPQQAAVRGAAASQPVVPAPAALPPSEAGDLTGTVVETATGESVDPTAVDQEVQKLLAAERARLEAQARAQQQAQQASSPQQPVAAPVTQTTAPPAQPPAQQAAAPATATVAPAVETPPPAPVAQQPATEVAQQPAAEARPAVPQTPRAQEGDLVQPGTAGLTPPRVIRRGAIAYPALARAQKVEGTVITNVLVSETGQVLEVRIVRGVSRAVGLNEAAEQAMRRSQFAPGMKDGVRVKSWITVPVEFRL
jgi:TonB family protein